MGLFDTAVGVFEEKMKAYVAEYVQGIIDKKKLRRFLIIYVQGRKGAHYLKIRALWTELTFMS